MRWPCNGLNNSHMKTTSLLLCLLLTGCQTIVNDPVTGKRMFAHPTVDSTSVVYHGTDSLGHTHDVALTGEKPSKNQKMFGDVLRDALELAASVKHPETIAVRGVDVITGGRRITP